MNNLLISKYPLLFEINFASSTYHGLVLRMSFIFSPHVFNSHIDQAVHNACKQNEERDTIVVKASYTFEEVKP